MILGFEGFEGLPTQSINVVENTTVTAGVKKQGELLRPVPPFIYKYIIDHCSVCKIATFCQSFQFTKYQINHNTCTSKSKATFLI